jgi:hypothetical protein
MKEETTFKDQCVLCGGEITVSRLATTFVENGTQKEAHDSCLGKIEPARARTIEIASDAS